MLERILQNIIQKKLFHGKIILLFGPRQCGKTTLVKILTDSQNEKTLWLNADEREVREQLSDPGSASLKRLIGKYKLVVIDEAQRIQNIGLTLKIIADTIKTTQVIATGSSAFELADKVKESLTGRKFEYYLFPFSFEELVLQNHWLEEKKVLENRLIFGTYPEVINNPTNEKEILTNLSDSVLYKDLFALEKIKKPYVLEKLLKALALQIGNEISFHELSQMIDADKETVERYLYFLDKSFITFRLHSFSRNLRNELKKSRKVYFYDNGIRNSLISNFSPLELRIDKGALWENYLVSERMKFNHYHGLYSQSYFWRTQQQQEIDYIEDKDGKLFAFEFKYSSQAEFRFHKIFREAYPEHSFKVIHKDNYQEFLLPKGK